MHWEKLPKVVRNEDAIREYEREESKRLAKLLKRFVWIALPVALLIGWFCGVDSPKGTKLLTNRFSFVNLFKRVAVMLFNHHCDS
jgi:hypothetical protein